MNERMKAIEEYLKYFPKDYNAKTNMLACKYAEELELELSYPYPRMTQDQKDFLISKFIKATKTHKLDNKKTDFVPNGIDTIIVWEASKLDFVKYDYYFLIDDEWQELIDILLSYNPVDYDAINEVFIYDLENGKKLIQNSNKIVSEFKDKIRQKINKIEKE
jgi:hypothetical protein